MYKIRDVINDVEIIVGSNPVWLGGVWECGDQRFTDPGRDRYAVAPGAPILITAIEFKLLFPLARRVSINAARATDPFVDDFCRLLDDPRTKTVDLALPAVQEMLDYLVTANLLDPTEKAAILAYRRE